AVLQDIENAFIESGRPDCFITEYITGEKSARALAKGYSEKYGADCIIFACGSIGTVHEAANALAHTETPLGVLPLGKTGDIAAKLYGAGTGIYPAAEQLGLLEASPKMKIRRIDLGKCCGEYFISSVSLGFDNTVRRRGKRISEKLPKAAPLSEKLGFAASLLSNKKYSVYGNFLVSHTANGITRRYPLTKTLEHTLIAVTNSGWCGRSCPAPNAVLNDGLLEMAVAEPCNFAEVCAAAPMYRKGVADISGKVRYYSVIKGEFTSTDGSPFTLLMDGKEIATERADISVEQKTLKLCTSIFS
ncbi:MAG: diacylglycerol/lipid kinase family protein, partial [Oscillospiraceae bacterium]